MWSNNSKTSWYKDTTWAKPLNYVLSRIYYITPIVGKKHVKTCSKAMADLYKQEDKKSWSNKSQNVIIIVTVWILKLITCIVEKIPVE
jgi:hypothetical protein